MLWLLFGLTILFIPAITGAAIGFKGDKRGWLLTLPFVSVVAFLTLAILLYAANLDD